MLLGIQGLEGFDSDLQALAGLEPLPETGHDSIDYHDGEIANATPRQHSLCLASWNEAVAGMASNEVTVEVGQEAYYILRWLEVRHHVAGQQPGAVAFYIYLL
jgi:hypothetical protein